MKANLLLTTLFLMRFVFSNAQWQPDKRLTNDTGSSFTSYSNGRYIATSGDTVHIVWYDDRDANNEIYYKRSTDGGNTWGEDMRLTNNAAVSEFPSVAVSGAVVHVLWGDTRGGDDEIYYLRSTDGGTNWETEILLSDNDTYYSSYPSIAVTGQNIHVAWEDFRDGNLEIYYKRSTDGGLTWSSDTRMTIDAAESENPSVSLSGSVIHVAWKDFRDGNNEIYYKRSTDGGITWSSDTRLTNNSAHSNGCSLAAFSNTVHLVWYDERDGNREIYYKRSTDGGINWDADIRLTNDTAASNNPSVSAESDSVIHVAWHDERDGNKEIYYKRSLDGGVSWDADNRLTNADGVSGRPSVSVSGPVVHVVWYDERDGNSEIYYKQDQTGNLVSIDASFLNQNALQLYPNPFLNNIFITYSTDELCEIVIYDLTSKIVLQQEFRNSITLNTTYLLKGIYFYEVRNKEVVLKIGKIEKI